MFRIAKVSPVFFVLVIVVLASCSKYEKLLKSDDFQLKYEAAMEYYEEDNYVRAATLIEQILPIYRGTAKAAELSFIRAKSNYHRGDYIMAAYHFDTFIKEYPNTEYTEEATFMRAYCNYMLSPRPDLDQTSTRNSIDQFTLFISRYPESEKVKEAKELISEMRKKLLEKSYRSAKLYYEMSDFRSAIIAFKNSLADFPETENREEIMFLILKSSYLLADRSVAERQLERFQSALNEYYAFIEEFPESDYMNEAKQIMDNSLRVLDNYTTDDLTNGN